MNATELAQFRSQPLTTSTFNIVSGIIHCIYLLWHFGTLWLWYKNVMFKKKITGNYEGTSKGARLIIVMTLSTCIHEFGYLGFIGAGFSRAGGVIGVDEYSSKQIGYLNSDSNFWCKLSSLLLYFGLSNMVMWIWILMRHVYKLATTVRGKSVKNSLNSHHTFVEQIRANPRFVIAIFLPILNVILQIVLSDQGPMGSYCGVRCNEIGMDKTFTSPNRCWLRLACFYWLCLLFGPLIIADAFRLIMHIRSVHKMSEKRGLDQKKLHELRKKKKNNASTKMRDRLTRFAFGCGFAMIAASLSRIAPSLNPDPLKEGTVALTEYTGLILSPFIIMTFSIGLWSDFFGCSAEVKEQNAEYVRRNSFRGSSMDKQNSDLGAKAKKSMLLSPVKELKIKSSSTSKYVVGKGEEEKDGPRDSDLGASSVGVNSEASTQQLASSPSANSPYVTERPPAP